MDIAGPLLPAHVQESKTNSVLRPHLYSQPQDVFHVSNGSDIYWKLDDMKGDREAATREGAKRKATTKDVVLTSFKTQAMVCAEPVPQVKGVPGQDSDVDSGIVGCGKSGQRVGSTSSTDTDSSQESRQKIDFCRPVLKKDQVERISGVHFRTAKRTTSLTPPGGSGGPVKADHSVLKECNRRPPTPLTVFGESNHCVRFDDQLQLSEQNIRRSCRKLFATLYAQRFSYPSASSEDEPCGQQCDGYPGTQRNRSQTLPDAELRKARPSKTRTTTDSSKNKENSAAGASVCRKAVSWNLNIPDRLLDQMSVSDSKFPKQVSSFSGNTQKDLATSGNIPVYVRNCRSSLKASTDSGLGGCRTSCTCQCTAGTSGGYSSQSSTSSKSSTSSHCCCCSPQTQPPQNESPKGHTLFKSSSCSTLPSMLMQPAQRPAQQKMAPACGPAVRQRCPIPLQKTSSCSSLMNKAMNLPMTSVPVYNDSMVHVYAQVASVVPDESTKTSSSHTGVAYQRTNSENGQIYDTVRSPPVAVSPRTLAQRRNNAVTFRSYKSPKRTAISICTGTKDEAFLDSRTKCDSSLNCDTKVSQSEPIRASTPSELYAPLESRLVPYRRENRRENPYCTMTSRRQNTVSVSSLDAPNGYLKSALKQPKTVSQQNVYQPTDAQSQNGSATRIAAEAEYAVVDKSKKNRFTSLPALNKFNSNTCIPEDDKDQPPVPPKKNLYKSDFNIHRSRSSSPRKTFLERVNGFTKSAKHAFQRAFSTERIYRPEREERLEATGQNLHRSKSFIKGLRASLSKKRKKSKPPMAEVVPQASSNPLWDQHPSGPNSPVHVHGQLLQLNLDGSQVVELSKPPNRPYGFFVARGRVRNCRGVFVSRMRDQETQKQLAGLLDIGDEILEIEGLSVKNADIMEVNNLMANKNTLLLTVLPYICRKDI